MPSFKERFRSSRKYKKNKETAASGIDEPNSVTSGPPSSHTPLPTLVAASAASSAVTAVSSATATANSTGATADERTGSVALATYYSIDQCEC